MFPAIVLSFPRRPALQALLISIALQVLIACSDSSDSRPGATPPPGPEPEPEYEYSAQIERTRYGTAHITAESWKSLGFGQGYAFAQDRFCVLADQVLKVRSQRARYFGPGENNEHVSSDFAYLALEVQDNAEAAIASLSPEGRDVLEGYVSGVNHFLEEQGVDNLPGECAGEDWVAELDAPSLMAYYLDVAMLAGSRNFIGAIATAAPPADGTDSPAPAPLKPMRFGGASNGIAIGSERSDNGRGLLLSNTHLPWEGELRYHEVHLTLPGEYDAAGVTLSGVMGVLIGFNDSIAWTHTTSPSNQFVIYTLDLVPDNPTRYVYGDEERDMRATTYRIEVLQEDGSLQEQTRTLYHSHYGPMLNPSAFGLAWTENTGYTIFDINAENGKLTDTFRNMAQASSMDELRQVFEEVGGVPWNHTMATDRSGEVLYADTTLVPKFSEAGEAAFRELVEGDGFSFTKLAFGAGVVAVDGSDPTFAIEEDDSATVAGAIPFSHAPQLVGRRDFVANANDSYWLSNPQAPLSGYSLRYGDVETPRSLRTRMGLTQLAEGQSWGPQSLQGLLFANRSYTETLWRQAFLDYCTGFDQVEDSGGNTVDIAEACTILANWDGVYNLDSMGAILFREMMTAVNRIGLVDGEDYFTRGLDLDDPVDTPSGLSEEGKGRLLVMLADAVTRLEAVGIPLDAPLGDYQYGLQGQERFPLHGGQGAVEGMFNIAVYSSGLNTSLLERTTRPTLVNPNTDLTEEGYLINFGASFIMTVSFTDDGPVAEAMLTYSQSDDPGTAHFSDQMALYSDKQWRPLPFSREQIESDPDRVVMEVNR